MIRFRRLAPSVSLALATAAVLVIGWSAPARAQEGPPPDEPSSRRLDRLERELREVRQIVLQAHATGQPVEIKEAGPDPQVVALQGRIDDIDGMVRRMTGELETVSHQVEVMRKDLDDSRAQTASLADRVDKLEKQSAAVTAPPPPPPPPGADANAAAGPPPTDAKTAYAHARQLLEDGDYAGAATELQAFIDHFGSSPVVPAARYWLGEARYIQKDYQGAATAYLGAIRGWPKTSWAPEAVVKLSQSLIELGKPQDACGALGELDRRYPRITPALKARAAAARTKAQCSG